MKKLTLLFNTLFALSIATNAAFTIDAKVLHAFQQQFPKASEVNWSEQSNGFWVDFKNDGIRYKLNYDLEGKVVKSIRYYFADKLPPLILIKITEHFPKLHIYGVTETNDDEGLTYNVVLEDAQNWYNVSFDETGLVQKKQKFHKA